ncbi:GNAT family N-acetyltransferase [Streptomyces sp. NBC_01498]|uniref:GNAT family N-acetyltransferase n=1 Tax=Streptomyces sp. NBC_01498 TaxID=2975870 RepID=UPI002E7B78BF|nr:GNAT family N-acetyltransferase [Streptomyces sp. NBC_01498]WTL25311.1 GNAT family N-acetyltransferase [Streptomyces sp. NBC_01498]
MEMTAPRVRLEPWSLRDLGLLRAANAPELMTHLGGPESEERLLSRHLRYVALSTNPMADGLMFRIVLLPDEEPVGNIGFWPTTWRDQGVYEAGWTVLGEFQGRGLAVAATREVAKLARAGGRHRWLMAHPSVANAPSNGVCRKAGFVLLGEAEIEYPAGHLMRCNEWRLDLEAAGERADEAI